MTTYAYSEIRGGYDDAAQTAINRSSIHEEIVTLTVDHEHDRAALVSALEDLADHGHETDSVENGDVTEVWAYDPETGDDSMEWRVHVRLIVKRTEDAWWTWHDQDYSRTSSSMEEAEARCSAWVAGESDDGPRA